MKIVFATNNTHKLEEIKSILGDDFEIQSLDDIGCHDDIPETGDTLEANALQKAAYIYDRYRVACFADDTGLEVDALGGAPGVHTARYAGEAHDTNANVDKLLRELHDKTDRRARFRTVICLLLPPKDGSDKPEKHLFEGRIEGFITSSRHGDDGFGYDPVFRPEGYDGTFAQLGMDIKNRISHRALAVAQLAEYLHKIIAER